MILGIIDEDFVVTKDNRIEELEERGRGDFELWILNFCN